MNESFYQFDCPCCGKRIEFDPRSHRARAVQVKEGKSSKDFDALLAAQKSERERLEKAFGQAMDAQRKQREELEALLRDAKRKAKENPDEPPPLRPFDLD